MKKQNTLLVILLTCLVFLSAVTLGVSSVYRVDEVTLKSALLSKTAQEESAQLQNRLQAAYEKQSTFSVKQSTAEEIVKDFPYLRMVSFKKVYPNLLIVEVVEDEEVFALPVLSGEGYYIVGKNGLVLGVRESYTNRIDGVNNLLITGLNVSGEQGKELAGDVLFAPLMRFCASVNDLLGGIRRNVESIEILKLTSNEEEAIVCINMQEGVKIYVRNLAEGAEEKAKAAVEKYLSIDDVQRTMGRILVAGQGSVAIAAYAEEDEFDF